MEWKTIDSAPKDGTRILLFDGCEDCYVANWRHGEWVYAKTDTDYEYYETVEGPTHWMPLPLPPPAKQTNDQTTLGQNTPLSDGLGGR